MKESFLFEKRCGEVYSYQYVSGEARMVSENWSGLFDSDTYEQEQTPYPGSLLF